MREKTYCRFKYKFIYYLVVLVSIFRKHFLTWPSGTLTVLSHTLQLCVTQSELPGDTKAPCEMTNQQLRHWQEHPDKYDTRCKHRIVTWGTARWHPAVTQTLWDLKYLSILPLSENKKKPFLPLQFAKTCESATSLLLISFDKSLKSVQ